MEKISNKAEWTSFEVKQWRDAIKERGLRLASLDSDQQKLVSEALGLSNDVSLKALVEAPTRESEGTK